MLKTNPTVSEKKELSSTLTGFKTAVQKAAFKHDKVFFLHTSNFTSVTSVCCISLSLSPSFYSLPTPPHLLFALMFFYLQIPGFTMHDAHSRPLHHRGCVNVGINEESFSLLVIISSVISCPRIVRTEVFKLLMSDRLFFSISVADQASQVCAMTCISYVYTVRAP